MNRPNRFDISRKAAWRAVLFAGSLMALIAGPAAAQDSVAKTARGLLDAHKGSLVVVTVEGRLTTTTDGAALPDQAQQRRTLGVTIKPTGLIVISNSAVDPAVGLAGQKARMDDKVVTIQTAKTVFEKVEISYGDSTVLPGMVIGQDIDADVAFVLPDEAVAKKLGKTFAHVDLASQSLSEPADEVVGLSRSSSAYAYMPTVIVGRVTGVFNGERRYFVTTAGTAQGIPIFALDGKLVGITLERIIENKRTNILGTLAATSIGILADLSVDKFQKSGGAAAVPAAVPAAPPAAPATKAPTKGAK